MVAQISDVSEIKQRMEQLSIEKQTVVLALTEQQHAIAQQSAEFSSLQRRLEQMKHLKTSEIADEVLTLQQQQQQQLTSEPLLEARSRCEGLQARNSSLGQRNKKLEEEFASQARQIQTLQTQVHTGCLLK